MDFFRHHNHKGQPSARDFFFFFFLSSCKAKFFSRLFISDILPLFQGAAVAYVADLLKVPAIFLKAVTDIVDGDKPTADEFLQNLAAVAAALDQAVTEVIDYISGKCLSEL